MTAEDAVVIQLACQTLGTQASTPALLTISSHNDTKENETRKKKQIFHSEATGILSAMELSSIRVTVYNAVKMVDEILIEKGMMSSNSSVHLDGISATKWGGLQPYFGR